MSEVLRPDLPIFIVDDEYDVTEAIGKVLRLNGYNNIVSITDSREVVNRLNGDGASVMLLDISMPHIQGDKLLEEIASLHPTLPVIMATADDSIDIVVECMRKGAFDYVAKPLTTGRLLASVKGALDNRELRRENDALRIKDTKGGPKVPEHFSAIITRNARMLSIFKYIEAIAPGSQPVVITGETGVGKELASQAIHRASGRKGRFIAINVAGVDDDLFADTLFGHVKGAYTGANQAREGQVKLAAGGTLFLDEIGELSKASQIKLLRLLQENNYQPLGTDVVRESDARIIVATNKKLEELVARGEFRKDLYYRLYCHQLSIPPLRERLDDLPLLVDHFVKLAAREYNRTVDRVSAQVYEYLQKMQFSGNIRELQAVIFNAVSVLPGRHLGVQTIENLVGCKCDGNVPVTLLSEGEPDVSFGHVLPSMREVKLLLVEESMQRAGGSITTAAKLIGISRQALSQFLKRNHISH